MSDRQNPRRNVVTARLRLLAAPRSRPATAHEPPHHQRVRHRHCHLPQQSSHPRAGIDRHYRRRLHHAPRPSVGNRIELLLCIIINGRARHVLTALSLVTRRRSPTLPAINHIQRVVVGSLEQPADTKCCPGRPQHHFTELRERPLPEAAPLGGAPPGCTSFQSRHFL